MEYDYYEDDVGGVKVRSTYDERAVSLARAPVGDPMTL